MELKLALTGDLRKHMETIGREAAVAVSGGVRLTAKDAQQMLRDQITGAGMGRRLANAWRLELYPPGGKPSMRAAALIYTRAPMIVRAFDEGVTIRSTRGFFLAIPTENVPKNLTFMDPVSGGLKKNKRATPRGVEQAMGIKLHFVYRRGQPSLLVANLRARRGGRGGFAAPSKTALKTGRGLVTVVMFVLVPQVTLPKRLNVASVEARAGNRLAENIVRSWPS